MAEPSFFFSILPSFIQRWIVAREVLKTMTALVREYQVCCPTVSVSIYLIFRPKEPGTQPDYFSNLQHLCLISKY